MPCFVNPLQHYLNHAMKSSIPINQAHNDCSGQYGHSLTNVVFQLTFDLSMKYMELN